MISVALNGLSVLQFNNLTCYSELLHFSTMRGGGSSSGNYRSLNLGFNSGDERGDVLRNRNHLCSALGISGDRLLFPKQTHTSTVKVIRDSFLIASEEDQKNYLFETDAIITRLRGICVAVKTADCVPVLLFDPKQKVVAAIHAGWRGTAQCIVSETIRKMFDEFGSNPSDLVAGIGPSISPEVYEVGPEVWNQFSPEFYHSANPRKDDKRLLDLWKANHHQLVKAGVPSSQIETAGICTLFDQNQFFSARRDGPKTGRMATGIMMRG